MGMNRPHGSDRFSSLDPLRGILCILVVLEHAMVALWSGAGDGSGWEGGLRRAIVAPFLYDLGAPLFFVISGYCIGASLLSMRRKNQPPLRFLAKRVWRIFPPYWCSILLLAALVVVLDVLGLGRLHKGLYALELYHPSTIRAGQWLGNLTLTETWRPLIGGPDPVIFTRICWSLCYQEQFYLICLLALALAPRRLVSALGLATAAIVGFRVLSWDTGFDRYFAGLFFDYWHQFAAGLFVFWRLNLAGDSRWRFAVEAGLVAMLGIGLYQGLATTAAASLLALGLIVVRRFDDVIARQGWLSPLRALGARSYGVYLAHLPACAVIPLLLAEFGVTSFWGRALLTVPIASIAGIASGWAFHALVDRHFQKLPSDMFASLRRLPAIATTPAPSGA